MVARARLICRSEDLEDGGRGVRFEIERPGGTDPAFVVRYRGKVCAYYNRCAHAPSQLDWVEGEFFDGSGLYLICATHGALYDPATGACLAGRCDGRGLHTLAVEEREGGVYLMEKGDRSG